MDSPTETIFYKQVICPSSEVLLAYKDSSLALTQQAGVASHLAACDFCGAELKLLAEHFPAVEEEECAVVAIPLNLRLLAEALLTRQYLTVNSLVEIALEKEGFSLTDA